VIFLTLFGKLEQETGLIYFVHLLHKRINKNKKGSKHIFLYVHAFPLQNILFYKGGGSEKTTHKPAEKDIIHRVYKSVLLGFLGFLRDLGFLRL